MKCPDSEAAISLDEARSFPAQFGGLATSPQHRSWPDEHTLRLQAHSGDE